MRLCSSRWHRLERQRLTRSAVSSSVACEGSVSVHPSQPLPCTHSDQGWQRGQHRAQSSLFAAATASAAGCCAAAAILAFLRLALDAPSPLANLSTSGLAKKHNPVPIRNDVAASAASPVRLCSHHAEPTPLIILLHSEMLRAQRGQSVLTCDVTLKNQRLHWSLAGAMIVQLRGLLLPERLDRCKLLHAV